MHTQCDQERKEDTNLNYQQSSGTNTVTVYQLEYISFKRLCVIIAHHLQHDCSVW